MKYELQAGQYIRKLEGALDPLFEEAARVLIGLDKASASLIQRKLSLGYARAARILDQLEVYGVVSSQDDSKPRMVLVKTIDDFQTLVKNYPPPLAQPNTDQNPNKSYAPLKIQALNEAGVPLYGKKLFDLFNNPQLDLFKSRLVAPLGVSAKNEVSIFDYTKLGHLLVTGHPLSEKLHWVDSFLLSFFQRETPKTCKLIIIDPSSYLHAYAPFPHNLTAPITETEKAIAALDWSMSELEKRFKMMQETQVRTIAEYNDAHPNDGFPRILIVLYGVEVLDFNDMSAANIENIISRGHRAGIHVLLITDKLSRSRTINTLKSNLVNRLIFRVGDTAESRMSGVIGAEKLSVGEALYVSFDTNEPVKITAPYISPDLIKRIIADYR